jgi:hypothetical protein
MNVQGRRIIGTAYAALLMSWHYLSRTHVPRSYRLNFSMYQSGVDFKCPYSNRPFKALNPP